MTKRTVKSVQKELKRTQKASKRLKKDLILVMQAIGAEGGLQSPDDPKVKCNPNLRRLREVQKSLDVLAKIEKALFVELSALEQSARQEAQEVEYSL